MWHGYYAIENLALDAEQRALLVDALQAMGPTTSRSPALLNHWRTRTDGEAAIFEALFDTDALTVDAFKTRLASIFDISPAAIEHDLSVASFAGGTTNIAVFSYGGTDYLRMALFGGLLAAWQESGDECRGYLALYADQWGIED